MSGGERTVGAAGRAGGHLSAFEVVISSSAHHAEISHARTHACTPGRSEEGTEVLHQQGSRSFPPIPEPPESGQMRSSDPASESHAAAGTNQCTWTSARVRRAHTSAC